MDNKKLKEVIDTIHKSTYNHFIQGRITFEEFCIVRNTLRDVIELYRGENDAMS